MHLGKCEAGTSLSRTDDPAWQTPCRSAASVVLVIEEPDHDQLVSLCAYHHSDVSRRLAR